MVREREGRAVEPGAAVINSQSVKTSAQGGPKGYDAGKKVKGHKRHLIVDTLGLLLAVVILTADISDPAQALILIDAAVENSQRSKGFMQMEPMRARCQESFEANTKVSRLKLFAGQPTQT